MNADKDNLRLAVLIDADNTFNVIPIIDALFEEISKFGDASVRRIYGDWTSENLKSWKPILPKHAIQPIQQYANSKGKNAKMCIRDSVEVVQWLTNQWGAAVFIDMGNAANRVQDLDPVYGYGLGARWKSPIGPIGADIAYGEDTGKYRLHFNIGVAF